MNKIAEWILAHKEQLYAISLNSWYYPCGCMLTLHIEDSPAIEIHISDAHHSQIIIVEARYAYNNDFLGRVEAFYKTDKIYKNSYWNANLDLKRISGKIIVDCLQELYDHALNQRGEIPGMDFRGKKCTVCSSIGEFSPISATHAFCKKCRCQVPIQSIMMNPNYKNTKIAPDEFFEKTKKMSQEKFDMLDAIR